MVIWCRPSGFQCHPQTFVIDAEGRIHKQFSGLVQKKDLQEVLEKRQNPKSKGSVRSYRHNLRRPHRQSGKRLCPCRLVTVLFQSPSSCGPLRYHGHGHVVVRLRAPFSELAALGGRSSVSSGSWIRLKSEMRALIGGNLHLQGRRSPEGSSDSNHGSRACGSFQSPAISRLHPARAASHSNTAQATTRNHPSLPPGSGPVGIDESIPGFQTRTPNRRST